MLANQTNILSANRTCRGLVGPHNGSSMLVDYSVYWVSSMPCFVASCFCLFFVAIPVAVDFIIGVNLDPQMRSTLVYPHVI